MDSEYLKRTVGEALTVGLADVAIHKPADPIDHLANYLLKHCDNVAYAAEREDLEAELEIAREEKAKQDEIAARMREEEKKRKAIEAQKRAEFEEEQRELAHQTRMTEYTSVRKELEDKLDAERIVHHGEEIPLKPYKKARLRLERMREIVATIDHSLLEEMRGYTPETHPNEVKVVRGVLFLLGYSRESVMNWERVLEIVTAKGKKNSIIQKVIYFRPSRPVRLSRLERARAATKGIDLSEVANSNFAIYTLFEWLDVAVDVRNERITQLIEEGEEELEEGEEVMFSVGEPGKEDSLDDLGDSETEFEVYEEESEETELSETEEGEGEDSLASGSVVSESDY